MRTRRCARRLRSISSGPSAASTTTSSSSIDLDRHVSYIGYVPHATSLQYLAESDVLFLCQIPVYESASTKLSGKLFEYLYMRKPILALTLPGLTTDILSRSGLGIVVAPDDRPGIKGALQHLYRQHKVNHLPAVADNVYIQRFDRVDQSRCLSRISTNW